MYIYLYFLDSKYFIQFYTYIYLYFLFVLHIYIKLDKIFTIFNLGFPGGSDDKEATCNAGDLGSILVSGQSPGEGNSYPLEYSCLENPTDREAW